MKIKDYKIGTEFEITCCKQDRIDNKLLYTSFQISKEHASIWGRKPEDVIKVKGTIIEEDVIVKDLLKDKNYDKNCLDYFGKITFNEDGTYDIGLIYGNIKTYFICFPYGPDALRFWDFDNKDYDTGIFHHKTGDRRSMTVRIKFEEI